MTDFCRDPSFATPLEPTLLGQPITMARQPSPIPTSTDWCSSLFLGETAVTSFTFPHDTLAVSGGQITYVADDAQRLQGSYNALINTHGPATIDLSPACLTRAGANPTCDMVGPALARFAAMKPDEPGVPCTDSPSERALCQFYYSYQDINCTDRAGGGCRCTYDVSFAGALHGRWLREGNVLTHSDASKMLPSQADYCVDDSAGSLALWGHARTSILSQPGIRTLKLQKAASMPAQMP